MNTNLFQKKRGTTAQLYNPDVLIYKKEKLRQFIDYLSRNLKRITEYEIEFFINEKMKPFKSLSKDEKEDKRDDFFDKLKDSFKEVIHFDNKSFQIKLLGEGAYGVVYKVTNIDTKVSYAAKFQECDREFDRELDVFKRVTKFEQVPHFPRLFAYFDDDETCIIYMKVAKQTLTDALEEAAEKNNFKEFISLIQQMIITIYLFRTVAQIYHCDTHLDNFFIMEDKPPVGKSNVGCWEYKFPGDPSPIYIYHHDKTVQIFDFGLSQQKIKKPWFRKPSCTYLTDYKRAIDDIDLEELGVTDADIITYINNLKMWMKKLYRYTNNATTPPEVILQTLLGVPVPKKYKEKTGCPIKKIVQIEKFGENYNVNSRLPQATVMTQFLPTMEPV